MKEELESLDVTVKQEGELIESSDDSSSDEGDERSSKNKNDQKDVPKSKITSQLHSQKLRAKRKRNPEQRAQELARLREIRANWTPEERARNLELRRQRTAKRTPEEKQQELERRRKRRADAKKREEEMAPEERKILLEKRRLHRQEKRTKMTDEDRRNHRMQKYFCKQAKIAKMSKEERQAMLKKNSTYVQNYLKNLPPDKKEEYRIKMNERTKIYLQKHPEKMNSPKILEKMRIKTAKETPDERQRRLRRYKINAARRKLKTKLEEEGLLSPEEIETMLSALVEELRSEPLPPPEEQPISHYKPRPTGRKPKKKNKKCEETHLSQDLSSSSSTRLTRELPNITNYPVSQSDFPLPSLPVISANLETPHEDGQQREQLQFPSSQSFEDDSILIEPPSCPPSPCVDDDDDNFIPDDSDCHSMENEETQQSTSLPLPPTESSPCQLSPSSELQGQLNTDHPWKCPTCSELLHSYALLCKHFKIKHSKKSEQLKFVCMRCPWKTGNDQKSNSFKTHKILRRHVQLNHPSSYWPCPACNLLLYSEPRYYSHLSACTEALQLNLDKSPVIICDLCGKSFRESKYNVHMNQVHHPDKSAFVCPICNRQCLVTRSFWVHFVRCAQVIPAHVTEGFFAAYNNQKGRRKRSSQQISEKEKEGPIPCEQCGKTFTQKCTLDDHIRRDHEGESNICSECHRNFQSAGKLWRHQAEVHKMTDLPPPPGVEVMRCKYCQDFVMRGYEMHVKKKHPEYLDEFRKNELPKVKQILAEVRKKNPSKMTQNSLSSKIRNTAKENEGKLMCSICSIWITQGCMGRHMKTQHPTQAVLQIKGIKCSKCDLRFQRPDRFECHYSEVHAFEGMEEKLNKGNLIKQGDQWNTDKMGRRKPTAAMCLICNVELPSQKLSVRVHFVAYHYEKLKEMFKSSS